MRHDEPDYIHIPPQQVEVTFEWNKNSGKKNDEKHLTGALAYFFSMFGNGAVFGGGATWLYHCTNIKEIIPGTALSLTAIGFTFLGTFLCARPFVRMRSVSELRVQPKILTPEERALQDYKSTVNLFRFFTGISSLFASVVGFLAYQISKGTTPTGTDALYFGGLIALSGVIGFLTGKPVARLFRKIGPKPTLSNTPQTTTSTKAPEHHIR